MVINNICYICLKDPVCFKKTRYHTTINNNFNTRRAGWIHGFILLRANADPTIYILYTAWTNM